MRPANHLLGQVSLPRLPSAVEYSHGAVSKGVKQVAGDVALVHCLSVSARSWGIKRLLADNPPTDGGLSDNCCWFLRLTPADRPDPLVLIISTQRARHNASGRPPRIKFFPPDGPTDNPRITWAVGHGPGQPAGGKRKTPFYTDTLHLVFNRPVRIGLGSKDVIHSFFVPAFGSSRMPCPGSRWNSGSPLTELAALRLAGGRPHALSGRSGIAQGCQPFPKVGQTCVCAVVMWMEVVSAWRAVDLLWLTPWW